jgi:hypothetical protein
MYAFARFASPRNPIDHVNLRKLKNKIWRMADYTYSQCKCAQTLRNAAGVRSFLPPNGKDPHKNSRTVFVVLGWGMECGFPSTAQKEKDERDWMCDNASMMSCQTSHIAIHGNMNDTFNRLVTPLDEYQHHVLRKSHSFA